VTRYAEQAADDGRIAARAEPVPERGWFCPPTVAASLEADSPVLREEVFGPLLTIEAIRDIEHGCEIIERLPYALTGGLFARDPGTVRYVRGRTTVGDLYVNRGITGAKVGRQPFGGSRLSGTGAQAGGPDYLLHFVEPRVVSENTMRHGLEM
jgi:RHH-type proline utilization regulon transcriptional repressor/proline dehydrogenase/delta 1-pyrroline-5-carboxylate dehydrogenase